MGSKKYWLKIKENFFDDDEMVFLKSQKNGYEYIYLWQRLLLKCLKVDEEQDCGLLRINNKVPYDADMLSTLFGINIDIVRVGIELFKKLGLLEILDDGTYYIEAVQKMIGKESESAERVRLHRQRKDLKLLQSNNSNVSCNPILIENNNIKKEEKDKIVSLNKFFIDTFNNKYFKYKHTEFIWLKKEKKAVNGLLEHLKSEKDIEVFINNFYSEDFWRKVAKPTTMLNNINTFISNGKNSDKKEDWNNAGATTFKKNQQKEKQNEDIPF